MATFAELANAFLTYINTYKEKVYLLSHYSRIGCCIYKSEF